MEGVNDLAGKSDVFFFNSSDEVPSKNKKYISHSELATGRRLQNIRLDGVGEHKNALFIKLKTVEGAHLKYSLQYTSKRDGAAKHFT